MSQEAGTDVITIMDVPDLLVTFLTSITPSATLVTSSMASSSVTESLESGLIGGRGVTGQ